MTPNASSRLFAVAEPDLSLAVSLLQEARQSGEANRAFKVLILESIKLTSDTEALIAAHRLRQNKPQYPLLSLSVTRECGVVRKLISAVAASTTLTSLSADHLPPSATSNLARHLKSLPTLRAVNHTWFADDVVLEVLQSRTNWSRIHLPTKPKPPRKPVPLQQ